MMIEQVFNKPKIIGVIGDINTGKSNFIYNLIKLLDEKYNYNLYTFGLRSEIGGTEIHSLNELEEIKDGIIFVDEFITLFNVEDRKKKEQIENSLRLIAHNNNILVLIGLPENFKKFISSKIEEVFYKKVTLKDFINGSRVKENILNYCGSEKGTTILNIEVDEVIYFNKSYEKIKIEYLEEHDTKKDNKPLLITK